VPSRTLAAVPAAFLLFGLAACSFQFGDATVTAAEVADAAEDALEEQLGSRPDIDCGDDDSITVTEGAEVDCLLTDPDTGTAFDTTVTFKGVDGNEWNADVQVAEEPVGTESQPSDPAESESSAPPADDSQGLSIEASRLAEASEDALEAQLGYRPEIDCGEVNIMIYVDRQTYCSLIDPADGAEYQVTVTVTSIEGQEFNFDIKVDDVPQG